MSETYDQIDKLTDAFTAQVMEHAESVLVLVTWRDGEKTDGCAHWEGNDYASKGIAEEWLSKQKKISISEAKRKET